MSSDGPTHARDFPLSGDQQASVQALVERRARREPMAYLLGRREFWSREFVCRPGALVPRADTETLIETALAVGVRPRAILDIGTGSGCILLTLLTAFPDAFGVGIDVSQEALEVASANSRHLGVMGRTALVCSSWCAALRGSFDLVVSNPPYIRSEDLKGLDPEIAFEPRIALDGGVDGLAAYRTIIAELDRILAVDGRALLEVGYDQAPAVMALAERHGLRAEAHKDLSGIDRCVALMRSR